MKAKKERWIIYSDEVDASKIPVEWFRGYILPQTK